MSRQQRRLKTITCFLWVVTACSCLVIALHRQTLLRIWRSSAQSLSTYGVDASGWIPVSDAEDQKKAELLAAPLGPEPPRATPPLDDRGNRVSAPVVQAANNASTFAASAGPASTTAAATTPRYVATYGFYIHAFDNPAAVIHQVRQLNKHFPDSPVYIMSDGGQRFDGLCKVERCTFKLCPPANDRWHPWPFFRRMYDAAVELKTEFVIMLEPDNTVHGPIKRKPKHDAGGLPVAGRRFKLRDYVEKQADKVRPGFKWTDRMMETGLCGGSYYRTDVILDAFSDEAVASMDWNYIGEMATKEMFSSDFAMPYVLAIRGYTALPWEEAAQMEKSATKPWAGSADAAFKHYGGGFPGGKPTYRLKLDLKDTKLTKGQLPEHARWNSNCQVCYSLKTYKKRWGSDTCTNKLPVKYSKILIDRYVGK